MKLTTTAILTSFLFIAASCSDAKQNNDATLSALNEKSNACIKIMNSAETQQTEAINTGNTELAKVFQKTIDSAARENVKIGQEIMALDVK